ncbi:GntP family permease [Dyadobacter sp. CY323]|uniref:GntP family permease n=1 Tax=Dyadobacter sp. CY323 TaxID=2907302 RepID=UPI001F1DCE51|nr:GntP family permease [Dyadobacter sp. CY323]MCE6991965.1 GntP family permease [Dyadobacter sp. CY323]
MQHSFLYLLICLLIGIAAIVLLTARYKVHAFFALIISCFIVGLGVQLPINEVITATKDGFGNIMKSLGLLIVLGTTLGVILEYTGSTRVMANYILKQVGEKRAPIAMSVTGFIIGLPIFCDSGYIVLSGLNQSLARRTGISVAVMAVSLATGLYSVHCLIPPHPGAAAAAGIIGVDFGKLILIGIVVAIPAAIVGYLWANYAGKKNPVIIEEHVEENEIADQPSVLKSFLPVIVPILLIGLKSFLLVENAPSEGWLGMILSVGDPVIALSIGVLLAFNGRKVWTREAVSTLLQDAAEKAGGILVIIGAGGAFGAVLAATKIGDHLSASLALGSLGIFFPFLLTSVLKTAQGSSTVAIITASSIVQPLLPALGLATGSGPLLCILSMGAGSMMISHANDAYFWVIAKFSGLDMNTMLRVYSISTVLMGSTSFLVVYILTKILM